MTRKAMRAFKTFLLDETGQTMLEYIVIMLFSIIVTIIFFRLVRNIAHRAVNRASVSFDTD